MTGRTPPEIVEGCNNNPVPARLSARGGGLKANYCASAVPRHEANDASNAPSLRRIAPLVYFFNEVFTWRVSSSTAYSIYQKPCRKPSFTPAVLGCVPPSSVITFLMPTFKRKARKPRACVKTGGLWNDEERQRLWDQRSLYRHMHWKPFGKSNPDTPQDPPAGRIVTLRTRANKRSLPDESAPESRPGKQTRTAAVLSSGKDQVEETDQNGMTDEDSSSDYEQDSDEETLQGPSLPFEEEESQDGIETIVIDDGNNDPESHQNGEEEAEVHRPDAEENTDEPVSRSTVRLMPGRKSMTPSSRSEEKYAGYEKLAKEATEPTRPSLPPDVEDLKNLNSDKAAKLESAQEEVRKQLQTIRSLEQREQKYKKEIDDWKRKIKVSEQQVTVLECKVAMARNQNKCETCERVSKFFAPASASGKAGESSGSSIS
ncbi:uncharacterized protein An01g08670 [Aspergillus niger]|uniref:Contig An01c0300, genomic contig n=2 Tax=Aspergillus niger TaxID=5061 RepID=A2Q9Q0_ASPNC|nr:uncharacterized protein An01g08670 [Aspergillus niger]CAK37112.1 unnamed protein product [Aspergillus niger]